MIPNPNIKPVEETQLVLNINVVHFKITLVGLVEPKELHHNEMPRIFDQTIISFKTHLVLSQDIEIKFTVFVS